MQLHGHRTLHMTEKKKQLLLSSELFLCLYLNMQRTPRLKQTFEQDAVIIVIIFGGVFFCFHETVTVCLSSI